MSQPYPHPQLGPNASWEELARAYGTVAAGLYERIPNIEASVERIEAAVLVADGAAHRAEAASQRVLVEAKKLQEMVRVLEMRVGGAEDKADEAHKSSHDLEKYLSQAAAETGRILDRRARDPNDRLDSERARAIAEDVVKKAKEAAAIGQKIEAYDQIQKTRQQRRERLAKIGWKVLGAVAVAAGLGAGGILWGQCQRAAGKLEGLQAAQQAAQTASAAVLPPSAVATASAPPKPAPVAPAAAAPPPHR